MSAAPETATAASQRERTFLLAYRMFCWALALLVLGGYALSIWAVVEFKTRTDATRGEILMVLPGVAFMLLCLGGVLLVIAYSLRPACFRWERRIFITVGIIGVLLLPGIAMIDFFNLLSV